MTPHESKGMCFFCLECICDWRVVGWDLVMQSPTCGPCLRRVRKLQQKVYGPDHLEVYGEIRHGQWASDERRIWAAEQRALKESQKTGSVK